MSKEANMTTFPLCLSFHPLHSHMLAVGGLFKVVLRQSLTASSVEAKTSKSMLVFLNEIFGFGEISKIIFRLVSPVEPSWFSTYRGTGLIS